MPVGMPMAVGEAQQGLQTVVPPHPARVAPPWLLQRVRAPCHMPSWMSSRLGCVAGTPPRFDTQSDKQAFPVAHLPLPRSLALPPLGALYLGQVLLWGEPCLGCCRPCPQVLAQARQHLRLLSGHLHLHLRPRHLISLQVPQAHRMSRLHPPSWRHRRTVIPRLSAPMAVAVVAEVVVVELVVVVVVVALGSLSCTQKGVAARVSPPPQVLAPPLPAPQPPPLL
jgi:hypothetical protein